MIEWVTVWVLTVSAISNVSNKASRDTYQLTYATQAICKKEKSRHEKTETVYRWTSARCDFQQVPVFNPNKKVK